MIPVSNGGGLQWPAIWIKSVQDDVHQQQWAINNDGSADTSKWNNMKNNLAWIATTLFLLGGCGLTQQQVLQSTSFGAATEAVGDVTEQTLLGLRHEMIEMNRYLMVLDTRKNPSNFVIEKKLPSVEAVRLRVGAAKALRQYGDVVLKLADPVDTKSLGSAAAGLAGELQELGAQTGKSLTDEQTGALGDVISAAGSMAIRQQKAKALKRFVRAYHPQVRQLSELIARDFDIDQRGMLRSYNLTAERLLNACNRALSQRRHSLTDRQLAIEGCVMAQLAQTRARQLQSQVKSVVSRLQRANQELLKVIDDKSYSKDELRDYASNTRSLINTLEVLAQR